MSHIKDILEIADEAIRGGEKVCNGANIHDMRVAISQVQFWRRFVLKGISEELLEGEGISDTQQLLDAIQRLREATLKAMK
jgi:hypothetical protein